MASDNKNVIYLEADEDITSAIDKLGRQDGEEIQVVTAKRSTLLQSVINIRLLDKAAKDSSKKLILVTNDRVTTNLASRLGVPVATRVGAAPVVAAAAAAAAVAAADDEIDGGTVGAKTPPPAARPEPAPSPEPTPAPEPLSTNPEPAGSPAPAPKASAAAPSGSDAKSKASKGSKVPNISSMQKRVLWIGGAILAIILLFALNFFFTKADVTLYAKASQVNTSFTFTADPSASSSNIDSGTLAATQVTLNKSLNASFQSTGEKDNGTKASGTMTVYNKYDSSSHQLVAGTRFVANGKTFRSTSDVTVPGGSLSGGSIVPGQVSVNVQADQNGDSFNLGPTQYVLPGLPAGQQSGIYGQGSQMSGGTSKISKVVTQADIDKAKQSALDADKDKSTQELKDKAGKGQVVLEASIQQNATGVDSNPDVGAEAQNGTVTVKVTYSGLAVKQSELSDLARAQEQKQIGPDKEIYQDGSDSLQLTALAKPDASGAQRFSARATAYAGTKIDKTALAKELKGKKYGDAVTLASQQPEIEKAEIKISPGWATSMPSITSHIKIQVKAVNQ